METPQRLKRNIHLQNIQELSTPLRIPPSPFMKNLGYGTGVNVYKLERSPKCGQMRSPWAVKRISQRIRANEHAALFNARIHEEAEILRKLSHPNIVGFRGAIKGADGVESLALECCKTSLGSILEERNDDNLGPLPAKYTLKMIVDMANALDYLHNKAKLLHGDLKSLNVLVKGDFEMCTNIWCAPEVIDELEIIDCKADIFSFGLVIYETIALVPPHTLSVTDTSKNDEECNNINHNDTAKSESIDESCTSISDQDNIDILEQACGTRPPLPQAFELTDDFNAIIEIFYCCTNDLAEDRPTAKTILTMLTTEKNVKVMSNSNE
ncbi:lymphokine-activated killer T-cell-originated protein kinase-like isoform X2 [Eurosta solidaginis]|uniref:lymphokine-activated killer T-cell-originated protein kinase-like isoform X2 n=1 Tax=Eurosta solidaginis TaxID=178769 RepID=UPI0035316A5C